MKKMIPVSCTRGFPIGEFTILPTRSFATTFQHRAISITDTARIKNDWSKSFLTVQQLVTFDRCVMFFTKMGRLCP